MNEHLNIDRRLWMRYALSLAETARDLGEVPIGALIVHQNKVLACGFNNRERQHSPLGHAEIQAIQLASQRLNTWRLIDCEIYSTLEPCIMCAGAIIQARIKTVTFGAKDPKGGAFGSLYSMHSDDRLNHKVEIISGILETECSSILKKFFRAKRKT